MVSSQPALSDLVFPSASEQPNLSHLLTDLKRANLSVSNRLRSIHQDARFVREVASTFGGGRAPVNGPTAKTTATANSTRDESGGSEKGRGEVRSRRPLVANERCGSWYVPPADKGASAYFKSTDGHDNAWKFSTRRLNLHLLEVIGRCDGCIIVDSTRRGKRMPDALSKTIPIWCSVLNRALFPDLTGPDIHALFTPPQLVSPSEHAQIEALLPSFVSSFLALKLDLESLKRNVSKPLRPLWVTPESDLGVLDDSNDGVIFEDFHPIFCCTASRRVAGGELTTASSNSHEIGNGAAPSRGVSYVYVQGAGDDTENWAGGLTAELWWAHAEELLSTSEADLPKLVQELVDRSRASVPQSGAEPKSVGTGLAVCSLPHPEARQPQAGPQPCVVALLPTVTGRDDWAKSPRQMDVGLGKHKIASRNLRAALPDICAFAARYYEARCTEDGQLDQEESRITVACESGRDISVAVALAISIWCFDEQGRYRASTAKSIFNKDMVKVRLGGFMTAYPEANPGRASLQSVNSFLMDYRR